jgi:hypothetical protein
MIFDRINKIIQSERNVSFKVNEYDYFIGDSESSKQENR